MVQFLKTWANVPFSFNYLLHSSLLAYCSLLDENSLNHQYFWLCLSVAWIFCYVFITNMITKNFLFRQTSWVVFRSLRMKSGNTERYGVSLSIQSKCGKNRPEKLATRTIFSQCLLRTLLNICDRTFSKNS